MPHMTHGDRIVRLLVAALLVLGLTAVAAPVRATTHNFRLERRIDNFWFHMSLGESKAAFYFFVPSCRTPAKRKQLARSAQQLSDLPGYLTARGFSERVHGRSARVSYNLKYVDDGVEYFVRRFEGQHWVKIGSRWFATCKS
jgi:hypothetical protein